MLPFLKRERFWNVPYSIFPSIYSINTPGCSSSRRTNATASMGWGMSFAVCRLLLHISFGEAPHLKQSYEPQILFLPFYKSGNKINFTNCPRSRLESKSYQASLKVGPRDTFSTIPHGVDQV